MIGYVQTQIQVTYLESYIYTSIARACKKIAYTATANKLNCAGIWVTI